MAALTLTDLMGTTMPVMDSSEDRLFNIMTALRGGEEISNADLLKYQFELSINSLTASLTSSIVKERCDTMKGVVQKF